MSTEPSFTTFEAPCGCNLLYTPLGEGRSLCTYERCAKHPAREPERHLSSTEYPDSIEIGTPAKGGAVKVYHRADDPEGWKRKLDGAFQARAYAQSLLEPKEEAKP